ncbi:MAG: GNAT family N-acetyltransferase [Granulosicoccus sp.]
MTNDPVNWEFHRFQTLNTDQLFQVMRLRTDVFVVEQQCAYPELDSHDNHPDTIHLLGSTHELVAYARAMPSSETTDAGAKSVVRIGRVVVAKPHRGTGLANLLMQQMMSKLESDFPQSEQVLSAQEPIIDFYRDLGFVAESDVYLEDGIPHIDMRRCLEASSPHS